ncbi:MAG TPA: RDD family protein [Burkholderiales bacterium]
MPAAPETDLAPAGLGRRLLAMLYDSLLLFAVAFFAGLAFVFVAGDALSPPKRALFQAYLFAVLGGYFVFCWRRGGATLAMRTWRLRLVRADGGPPRLGQACLRYALAWPSIVLGLGVLWALVDRDRQFLHDRLAGTRIVLEAPRAS